jgi:formylglycine-generating enzyme required for sulfatase activity
LLVFIAAMVPLLLLTACGDDSKKKENVNITISPVTKDIHLGQSTSFTVTVTGSSNTVFDLSTAPTTGAECSITGNTVVCTPTAANDYTLTVTAKADTTKTKTATLKVTEVSISISPEAPTVDIGESVTFTVTTQNTDFSVSSDPETGAGCIRADNTVICTPIVAEEYTLTVTAIEDSTKTATATFTAVEPGPDEVVGMVYVTAGTFMMGCNSGEGIWSLSTCGIDARPEHEVTLTEDFYIGKTEVTQMEWEELMGVDNNLSAVKGSNLPVTNVSWDDAQSFIAKLNEQNVIPGWRWSLPTEAQWEYAARGGSEPKNCEGGCRYSGSNNWNDVAWFGSNPSSDVPQTVGQREPNELGLRDMSGNVAEWVYDFWSAYSTEPQIDPSGPGSQVRNRRVVRGGYYLQADGVSTVVYRNFQVATANNAYYVGFRLALVPDPDAPAAAVTATVKPTFFESASETVSGLWDSAISGIKSLWNSITK